jgi:hypothetical protein
MDPRFSPGMRIRGKKGGKGVLLVYELEGFWKARRCDSGTECIVHEEDIEPVTLTPIAE